MLYTCQTTHTHTAYLIIGRIIYNRPTRAPMIITQVGGFRPQPLFVLENAVPIRTALQLLDRLAQTLLEINVARDLVTGLGVMAQINDGRQGAKAIGSFAQLQFAEQHVVIVDIGTDQHVRLARRIQLLSHGVLAQMELALGQRFAGRSVAQLGDATRIKGTAQIAQVGLVDERVQVVLVRFKVQQAALVKHVMRVRHGGPSART